MRKRARVCMRRTGRGATVQWWERLDWTRCGSSWSSKPERDARVTWSTSFEHLASVDACCWVSSISPNVLISPLASRLHPPLLYASSLLQSLCVACSRSRSVAQTPGQFLPTPNLTLTLTCTAYRAVASSLF
eukprot:scaffold26930_cov108-Isochrysis_galbana.AAC.3